MKKTRMMLPVIVTFLMAAMAVPHTAAGQETTMTPKEKLDSAFKACEEAPHAYFASCDAQAVADKARKAAQDDMGSSGIAPKAIRATYLKTVTDEDKTFTDMKQALDAWSAAIEQLKTAAQDYGKTEGGKTEAIVAAAMRAVESQEKEYRKNAAAYEQAIRKWEELRRPAKP